MQTQQDTLPHFDNHIGGRATPGSGGRRFTSTNPTTGQAWASFAESGPEDVDAAVQAAHDALSGAWGQLSATRRGRLLMNWGEKIAAASDRIARMESAQNGKLLAEMKAQANVVKEWLYYFGGLA